MLRLSDHTPESAMAPQDEAGVPATPSRWVREIVGAIPGPARSAVAELILGALLGGGGHVTQAVLALTPRLGWQAYHWMIEHGRFRLPGLVTALCGIVRRETCGPRRFAIIDATLAPRCSAKAPGVAVRFGHGHKPNRPAFLLRVEVASRARCGPAWATLQPRRAPLGEAPTDVEHPGPRQPDLGRGRIMGQPGLAQPDHLPPALFPGGGRQLAHVYLFHAAHLGG